MGTNYYARTNACKCCKRGEDTHIGKSSAGWTFSFHATYEIKSYKAWLKVLSKKGTLIFDEYDREKSLEDFKKLVEAKRDAKFNHAIECKDSEYDKSFLDEEGNSFSEGEFS